MVKLHKFLLCSPCAVLELHKSWAVRLVRCSNCTHAGLFGCLCLTHCAHLARARPVPAIVDGRWCTMPERRGEAPARPLRKPHMCHEIRGRCWVCTNLAFGQIVQWSNCTNFPCAHHVRCSNCTNPGLNSSSALTETLNPTTDRELSSIF